jgi:iron complex outermembrane receptor protein
MIGSRNVAGNTIFFNQGGVTYMGVEFEQTFYVGAGVSLYANGSLNSAKNQQTHQWAANAPDSTAAGGIIYNAHNVYASLLDKWVGAQYGDIGQTQGMDPYNELDLSIGYKFANPAAPNRQISVNFLANNLLNSTNINALAGYTADKTALWYTQPGRGFFFNVAVPL